MFCNPDRIEAHALRHFHVVEYGTEGRLHIHGRVRFNDRKNEHPKPRVHSCFSCVVTWSRLVNSPQLVTLHFVLLRAAESSSRAVAASVSAAKLGKTQITAASGGRSRANWRAAIQLAAADVPMCSPVSSANSALAARDAG